MAATLRYTYTGNYPTFVVPVTGVCDIVAFGAQGGSGNGAVGGVGGEIGGTSR